MSMQNRYLLLTIALIAVFIISQYLGSSSLFNKNIKGFDRGNSGLIATDSGANIYIAWTEIEKNDIILASSTPNRFTLDTIDGYSTIPLSRSIDASGSNVYLASIDNYFHPSKIILSKKSIENIHNIIIRESNFFLDYPIVKSVGPAVYIAWIEYINSNYQILFKYSHDNAKSFSDAIVISTPGHDASALSIDVEGSNVYIAWHENVDGKHKVLFRYSHDNAKSFSDAIVISKDNNAGFPSIKSEGSNVYMAWIDNNNGNRIVTMQSKDAGVNWDELFIVDIDKPTLPILDVDGPLVCLSWLDVNSLNIACSVNGKDFVKHEVSNDTILVYRMDVEGSNVYMAWVSDNKPKEFKIRASHDAGITLDKEVSIGNGEINKAGIIANGSNVYAIWSELLCINTCSNINTKIYLSPSYDSAITFEKPLLLK